MHDPIAAGRHVVVRAISVQVGVVIGVAVLFLIVGPQHALAAVIGGMALALGNALAVKVSLAGISSAGVAFGRLVLGFIAKWLSVTTGFAAGLVIWQLPPLPMLTGLIVGLGAYLWALNVRKSKST